MVLSSLDKQNETGWKKFAHKIKYRKRLKTHKNTKIISNLFSFQKERQIQYEEPE